MIVLLLWLEIVINMCFCLPIDQQIENEGHFCCHSWLFLSCYFHCWFISKFKTGLYIVLWLIKKVSGKWQDMTDWKIAGKMMRNEAYETFKYIYTIIIIVQSTSTEDEKFIVQYHKNMIKQYQTLTVSISTVGKPTIVRVSLTSTL